MDTSPTTPDPTPEYDALEPRDGENPLDALTRVGEEIVREVGGGSDSRDPSRKDKKLPKQLAALVALRAQGFDNHEIAERLGVTVQKLRILIAKARKVYGWSDLGDQIAHVAVPQAISNVIKHLDYEGTPDAIKKGQSTMTQKTVAGVGIFRSHSAVKQESKNETTNVLRVEISLPQLPQGATAPQIDGVLATPRRASLLSAPPVAPIIDGTILDTAK